MSNFVIIGATSDTHGDLPAVPSHLDVLLHAGDVCPDFRQNSAFEQAKWLDTPFRRWVNEEVGRIPFAMTWGNHDWVGMANIQPILRPTQLLVDKPAEIAGLRIYGSPWSHRFGNWAYMDSEEGLDARYARIPEGLDVLLVHGPPFGACDDSAGGENLGSKALLKHIRRAQPSVVICGHIHEARGDDSIDHGNGKVTRVHNVSYLNLAYTPYRPGGVKTIVYDIDTRQEVD